MTSVSTNPTTTVLGITGPISSGKSTVSKVLEAEGIPVLDTDEVVKDLYINNDEVKKLLVQNFGDTVVDKATNTVNHTALRNIVFDDRHPEKLELLDKLVHPFVIPKVQDFINQWNSKVPIIAVQVPKLFEAKMEGMFHKIWAIVVRPIDLLIARLQERVKRTKNIDLSREEALKWISRQWDQEEKAKHTLALKGQIIDNSGTLDQFKANTQAALAALRQEIAAPAAGTP